MAWIKRLTRNKIDEADQPNFKLARKQQSQARLATGDLVGSGVDDGVGEWVGHGVGNGFGVGVGDGVGDGTPFVATVKQHF